MAGDSMTSDFLFRGVEPWRVGLLLLLLYISHFVYDDILGAQSTNINILFSIGKKLRNKNPHRWRWRRRVAPTTVAPAINELGEDDGRGWKTRPDTVRTTKTDASKRLREKEMAHIWAGDYKHANTRTHRTNDREGSEWDIFIGRGHWRDRKSQPESRGYSLSLFLCVCVGIYTPYRRDYSASVSLSPSVLNRLVFLFSFVFFFSSCHLRWSSSFGEWKKQEK